MQKPSLRLCYKSDLAFVYHGDCMELIPIMQKGSVDLLVTDPPYGINYKSKNFDKIVGDNEETDVASMLGAATRVLRNHRHVYVFGFRSEQLQHKMKLGGTTQLIWDKEQIGKGNMSSLWGPSHEIILFGVHAKSAANRASGDGNLSARLRKGNVLHVARKNSIAVVNHPTEKPVELMRQLIESSSRLGEVVFDPFAGVCSTAVAAIVTGRKAIVCEIDSKYVDIGIQRIKQAEQLWRSIAAL